MDGGHFINYVIMLIIDHTSSFTDGYTADEVNLTMSNYKPIEGKPKGYDAVSSCSK